MGMSSTFLKTVRDEQAFRDGRGVIFANPIPELSNSVISARANVIRPLLRVRGELCIFEPKELFGSSLTLGENRGPPPGTIEEAGRVRMFSGRSAAGAFVPTMEEVVAQIPDEVVDRVVYVSFEQELTEEPGGNYFSLVMVLHRMA